MNKIERYVYDAVKKSPALKRRIRNLYQIIFDFFPTKNIETSCPMIEFKDQFFGFHDNVPFNSDETLVLSCLAPKALLMPKLGQSIELVINSTDEPRQIMSLGNSYAWNWHMGCKFQWFGDEVVLYNDLEDGNPVTKVCELRRGKVRSLPFHISSSSVSRNIAVGYSFSRAEIAMPGYGYQHQKCNVTDKDLAPSSDGLFIWEMDNGTLIDFIPISLALNFKQDHSMIGRYHIYTHAMLSPIGHKIAFMHRWVDPENIDIRNSRLLIYDVTNQKLDTFDTKGMVSHFNWIDNDNVIAYGALDGKNDLFFKGSTIDFSCIPIGVNEIKSDGHPSCSFNSRYFAGDTYPNRFRIQNLYVYDIELRNKISIGSFKHPAQFQSPDPFHHWCVDLHPRWSKSGRFISIDTCYSGVRSHCILDVSSIIIHRDKVA